MKTIKLFCATMIVSMMIAMTSCSSLSNMSSADAYNVGYGIGTLIRNTR